MYITKIPTLLTDININFISLIKLTTKIYNFKIFLTDFLNIIN